MNRPKEFDQKLISYTPMIWKMAKRLFPSSNMDDSLSTKNDELQRDLVQATYRRALEKWEDCGDGFVNWLRFLVLTEFTAMRNAEKNWPREDVDDKLSNAIPRPPNQEDLLILNETIEKAPYPLEMVLKGLGYTMEDFGNKFGLSKQGAHYKMKPKMDANQKYLDGIG